MHNAVGDLVAAVVGAVDPIIQLGCLARLAIILPMVLYLAVVIGVAMLIFSMFREVMIQPILDLL